MFDKLKRLDEKRDNVPGEHWLALAAGLALWIGTRKSPSTVVRLAAGIAGGLLVARAASGAQVPEQLRRVIPHSD